MGIGTEDIKEDVKEIKPTPWKYIQDALDNIDKYYGIKLQDSFKHRLLNEVINEMVMSCRGYLPEEFYGVCEDGTIKLGRLTNDQAVEVFALRSTSTYSTMNKDKYQKLLLKTNMRFTYCEDNNALYSNIHPVVSRYIMRHNLSHRIARICVGDISLQRTHIEGDIVALLDKYIKVEKNMIKKRHIFAEELGNNPALLNSEIFPLLYLSDLTMQEAGGKQEIYLGIDENCRRYVRICEEHNIPYNSFCFRVYKGISEEEALKMGIEENRKYGIICELESNNVYYTFRGYSLPRMNYNLIQYIRYLGEKEEKELGLAFKDDRWCAEVV